MAFFQVPSDLPSVVSRSFVTTGAILFVAYLVLVQILRFYRIRSIAKRYGYTSKDAIERMTIEDAETIARNVAELEFPTVNELALQFALFRTYGIPSVSGLLQKTGQFSNPKTSQKRYVDTVVIISEFAANNLNSFRAQKSLERLNWLHGRYKISQDDFLYTLALFMCQPTKFINEMEWRQITPMEKKAIWMFWSAIGEKMNIENIPNSFEEMQLWAEEYEIKHMIPAESNRIVAAQTISILLYFAPRFIHHYAKQVIYTVMDPRLRKSMMCPTPAPIYQTILTCIISARRLIIRHLMLPRIGRVRKIEDRPINPEAPEELRRYYYKAWDTDPWYVKPTLWNQYGVGSWICRMMGLKLPGKQFYGDKGYRIMELGPQHLEKYGPGNEEWRTKEGMEVESDGEIRGCPMAFN